LAETRNDFQLYDYMTTLIATGQDSSTASIPIERPHPDYPHHCVEAIELADAIPLYKTNTLGSIYGKSTTRKALRYELTTQDICTTHFHENRRQSAQNEKSEEDNILDYKFQQDAARTKWIEKMP
jgi:hypothetical protein